MRSIVIAFMTAFLLYFAALPAISGDFEEEFSNTSVGLESGDGDWVVYDEDSLGDAGPSSWSIAPTSPMNGQAMTQGSHIWGDVTDAVAIGSFVIYDLAEWADFSLEVEVVANDNDGMGLCWRWTDINNHYRYMTMVDSGNSPGGRKGPYRIIERRLGNDGGDALPYYETLADNKEAYLEGQIQRWKLEAIGNTFKFYVDDQLTLEAQDSTYESGKIGFIVYAQSGVYFDNLVITDLWAVDANGKLATTWAKVKKN